MGYFIMNTQVKFYLDLLNEAGTLSKKRLKELTPEKQLAYLEAEKIYSEDEVADSKQSEIKKAIEKKQAKHERVQDMKEACLNILTTNNIYSSVSGITMSTRPTNQSADEILQQDIKQLVVESSFEYAENEMSTIMTVELMKDNRIRRAALVDKLKFKPEYKEYANDCIAKLITMLREPTSVSTLKHDIFSLKYFKYQVKNKLINCNYLTPNPLSLIMYSGQGLGKTWTVESILDPVSEIYTYASSSELSKGNYEKNIPNLAGNYVTYFDDLDKLDESEIANFKSFITSSKVFYRMFFTQQRSAKANVSTTIATSNLPLSDLIYDETGNRRFYQFTGRLIKPKNIIEFHKEVKALNIDWLKVWQGIDENDNPMTPEIWEDVQKYQKIWGTRSLIHQFIQDNSKLFISISDKETAITELDLNQVQQLIKNYASFLGINLKIFYFRKLVDILTANDYTVKGINANFKPSLLKFPVNTEEYRILKSKYTSSSKGI